MNIYVGNVPYAATEADLEALFSRYGPVATATIIRDRDDGRSKGFGFVEMENQADGKRAIASLDGQEMMGRPLKVNPARPREQRRELRKKGYETKNPASSKSESSTDGTFHNPYTFVPTPPRPSGGFAGDFDPLKKKLNHSSLQDKLWTGHIPIKLTTVTPLVLLKGDGKQRDATKHQIYDVLDYIPESSLRGMLRSAYEVVTNSRYACFHNDDRLAYRMIPQESLKLIPAIIEDGHRPGELRAQLYPGTSDITSQGPNGPMYAAMLDVNSRYVGGDAPKTRDEVWAQIERRRHRHYQYWKAVQIWPKSLYPHRPGVAGTVIEGRVLITNENMGNKHDERVFFVDGRYAHNPITFDVTDLNEAWRMRIRSYRDAHSENDVFNREGAEGEPWKKIRTSFNQQDKMGWSPHLYEDGKHTDRWGRDVHDAIKLQAGDMVYARCEFDPITENVTGIKDLFPVMISRELYENSPEDLLDASLQPAEKMSKLSPADRLFGWVPQQKQDSDQVSEGGYKSRIRVVCDVPPRPRVVERFGGDGIPLAILGQPKPAQGRFYVAKDKNGTPQDDGISKFGAGYNKADKKGLRGRKHYWHHRGLEAENASEYWNPFLKNQHNEYLRAGGRGDTQNRSIKGWIKPNTAFAASLYVQNLQPQEVGALLWLLTLNKGIDDKDEKHYFRLGYGKPLGFGSVRMEIDEARLENHCLPLGTGEDWKTYYMDLNASSPAKLDSYWQNECLQKFQSAMKTAYNEFPKFEQLPFISGFRRILSGPVNDALIHYPRRKRTPDPDGKNFEWFVDNDHYRNGQKLALPKVTAKKGLPYTPKKRR